MPNTLFFSNRKILLALAIIFLLPQLFPASLGAQSAYSEEPDQVTLHLKWKHAFQFAGFYAAQSQGFFKDNGLEVVIKEPTREDSAIDAVLEGRAQFGVWGADLLNMRLAGEPVVALGVIFQHSPYAVISLEESGIRGPADLAGKTVEVDSKMGLAQLQAMLLQEGLPLTSINLVPHSWRIEGLINGEFDATFSYITDQPSRLLT